MQESLLNIEVLSRAIGASICSSLLLGILIWMLIKIIFIFIPQQKSIIRYRIVYLSLAFLSTMFIYSFIKNEQVFSNYFSYRYSLGNANRITPNPATDIAFTDAAATIFKLSYSTFLMQLSPYLTLCYFLGLLCMLLKMVWQMKAIKNLKKGSSMADGWLMKSFEKLKSTCRINHHVIFRTSRKINVPITFGFLKPVILFPVTLTTQLNVIQVESLILHELAHIKRNDYWWNFLQILMETFLFFNPATWLITSMIRTERENCCDDIVVKQYPSGSYAEALMIAAENTLKPINTVLAANGNKNTSSLLTRIKRITMKNQNNISMVKPAIILAVMLIMISFGWSRSFAKKEDKKQIAEKQITKNENEDSLYDSVQQENSTVKDDSRTAAVSARDENYSTDSIEWEKVEAALNKAKNLISFINYEKLFSNLNPKIQNSTDTNIVFTEKFNDLTKAVIAQAALNALDSMEIFKDLEREMEGVKNKLDQIKTDKNISSSYVEIQDKKYADIEDEMKNLEKEKESNIAIQKKIAAEKLEDLQPVGMKDVFYRKNDSAHQEVDTLK